MNTAIAIVLLLLLIVLSLFSVFLSLVVPTVLNVLISAFLAFKLSGRIAVRILLTVFFSASLSLNVRIPDLIMGGALRSKTPEVHIARKTLIGPYEKVILDTDSDYIYYRRTTEAPLWGVMGDFTFGIHAIPVIIEQPLSILRAQGISATSGTGEHRVVVHVRSAVSKGLLTVTARVADQGEVVATYRQDARRTFPLEEYDRRGWFHEDWRPYLLYLTQYTPWNFAVDLHPSGYSPLQEFLGRAIAQVGLSETGEPVQPTVESIKDPQKLIRARVRVIGESLESGKEIPLNNSCRGEDSGEKFVVSTSGSVTWTDNDIPPLRVLVTFVDGFYPSFSSVVCAGNHFWVSADHMNRINIWHYLVDFRRRSLWLREWIQADIPESAKAVADQWRRRRLLIQEVTGGKHRLYFINAKDGQRGRVVVSDGLEIEIASGTFTKTGKTGSDPRNALIR